MSKKVYVKPDIDIVALRLEERLAVCDSYYISSYALAGCNEQQWQITSPSTCFKVDETSVS